MEKITLALVISQPGHLRNGLQSLLRTIPQIEIIAESQDPSVLLKMENDIHPDLLIIDAIVIDEINWLAIANLKAGWPKTKMLILTDNNLQEMKAIEAGADFSLPKGFPASALVTLIENSLCQKSPDEISE